MALSKEQLLIPRVMCVGGKEKGLTDTSGEFVNGDILTEEKFVKLSGEWYMLTKIILEKICEDFPHLFRLMKWHEARPLVDMPEYLIFLSEDGITEFVLKVEKYLFHKDTNQYWAFEYLWENERDLKRMSLAGWIPATEQEYLEYKGLRKCPDCESTWKGDDSCPECFPI